MRVTIHQPECYPWLGFFDKLSCCDLAILFDTADFRKNYFHNRNYVRDRIGPVRLTVPVERSNHRPMREVWIAEDGRWRAKHERTLEQLYGRQRGYAECEPFLQSLYRCPWSRLVSFNAVVIEWLARRLVPHVQLTWSSSIGDRGGDDVTSRLGWMLERVGATTYLSGPSGREYLQVADLQAVGIAVEYHDFVHPVYSQVAVPFLPKLSALDAVLLHGTEEVGRWFQPAGRTDSS